MPLICVKLRNFIIIIVGSFGIGLIFGKLILEWLWNRAAHSTIMMFGILAAGILYYREKQRKTHHDQMKKEEEKGGDTQTWEVKRKP